MARFRTCVRFVFILFIVASWHATSRAQDAAQAAEGSASLDRRLQHFRHGINTSHWFSQVPGADYTRQHFETHTTAADIQLIRSAGFDHIRFSLNPGPFLNVSNPEAIPADYLAQLKRAITMILGNDLAVIVDVHPDSDFKRRLNTDPQFAGAFVDFWRALAGELNSFDPERVLLEPLNEPEMEDRDRWNGLQARLITAIRSAAPRHTIVACGHRYSAVDELLVSDVVADPNVVYNFHFYNPHIFTHQGATWGTPFWRHLRQVPYPSALPAAMPSDDFPLARLELVRYAHEGWNGERIAAEIAEAARWAQLHHVRLLCNEFGVYRAYVAPQARAAWLRDVRTALEGNAIGWTMWDYQGGFAVAPKQNGVATLDPLTTTALGLSPIAPRP